MVSHKVFPVAAFALLAAGALADGSVPADAVGEWRWGTINPSWYVDKYTGAYEGHAGGTAVYFKFAKDGTFTRYVYIETNSYGWRTQVMTTTEGTVEFDGDTFRLTTKKGKYKSISNRVAKHNFERPMTDDERKKDSQMTYYWSKSTDDKGKPTLKIGFTRDNLSTYVKEK